MSVADTLDLAIDKALTSIAAAKTKWAADVQDPKAFDDYVNGVADASGEDPNVVRRSIPAVKWAIFAKKADQYTDKWYNKTVNGFKKNWKPNYKKAFSTPAPAELLAQAGLA